MKNLFAQKNRDYNKSKDLKYSKNLYIPHSDHLKILITAEKIILSEKNSEMFQEQAFLEFTGHR